MIYPRIDVNISKIYQNTRHIHSLCKNWGIDVTGVTKVFTAQPEITEAYIKAGIKSIGDSRINNLKKISHLPLEKWLIRIPMLSEVDEVVQFANVSLNTEWLTIKALNNAAGQCKTIHKVILMADLGDLREGYVNYDELLQTAELCTRLPNIQLYGIGTNLGCFSYVRSDTGKMTQLSELAKRLPIDNPVVSGGNSSTLKLMMNGGIPRGITNLRLGESLLFGKERSTYTYLNNTHHDAFILHAEIVELKEKPSIPWGIIGTDSYGNTTIEQTNLGTRKKALLALGKQDCDLGTLYPIDHHAQILGANSDHLVLDITDSSINYQIGDIISFELGYFSVLRAFNSSSVHKRFINIA